MELDGFAYLLNERRIELLNHATDLLESQLHLLKFTLCDLVPVFYNAFYFCFISYIKVALQEAKSFECREILFGVSGFVYVNILKNLLEVEVCCAVFVHF